MTTPAETGLARWHDAAARRDASALPGLVAADAVFRSPAVHRPQEGRDLVVAYLSAAFAVLGPELEYVDEWVRERDAILEFRTVVDGLTVSGVDRITWDDDGLVTEFTVLIRTLKALHAVVGRMGAQLVRSGPSGG